MERGRGGNERERERDGEFGRQLTSWNATKSFLLSAVVRNVYNRILGPLHDSQIRQSVRDSDVLGREVHERQKVEPTSPRNPTELKPWQGMGRRACWPKKHRTNIGEAQIAFGHLGGKSVNQSPHLVANVRAMCNRSQVWGPRRADAGCGECDPARTSAIGNPPSANEN